MRIGVGLSGLFSLSGRVPTGGCLTMFGFLMVVGAVLAALEWLAEHWWIIAVFGPLIGAGAWLYFATRRKHQRLEFARGLLLSEVDQMSGRHFEHVVAGLMASSGYHQVRVVGGARDGGVDILAFGPDGRAIAVQCKRYAAKVGSPEVRNLIGAVQHEHRGRWPMLVTSSILTLPAWQLAQQAGVYVVQRDGLGRWMHDTRTRLAA